MTDNVDRLVAEYLKKLEDELSGLPRARRRELIQEIQGHIAEARADLAVQDEAAIRTLLDRIGDPAEIATEAAGGPSVEPPRARWRDVAALILLPIGGVVIPFLGWVAGVVLLWVSDAWTTRDKVLGALVLPGGLLVPIYFLLAGGTESSCIQVRSGGGPTLAETCAYKGGTNWGLVALVAVLFVAPLITAAYLARRMRRVSPAAAY
jgi:hypothetical protein